MIRPSPSCWLAGFALLAISAPPALAQQPAKPPMADRTKQDVVERPTERLVAAPSGAASAATEANPYVERLGQLRLLANWVDQKGKDQRDSRLREYHEGQARALADKKPAPVFANAADLSKLRIEGAVKAILLAGDGATHAEPPRL